VEYLLLTQHVSALALGHHQVSNCASEETIQCSIRIDYGIPLWGAASQSNIEILQRLQKKILRMVTNAPWYIPNHVLHTDLQIPTIREEITQISCSYKTKIEVHPNKLTSNIFGNHDQRRLRRYSLHDLSTRFN